MPEVALKKIQKECSLGRVAGPFPFPPIPNLRVSPLGIVPKKAPGEFRLIHHLSYPQGDSVNSAIDPALCTVRYASLDTAVRLIQQCGPLALLAKCDIQSAFRLLPIHPDDFCLLGFRFQGQWYVDKVMPMGCSVACAVFEAFSTFLEWVLTQKLIGVRVTHYLDDFLFMGPGGSDECLTALSTFQGLADELGVPLAVDKTEGPAPVLTYLGIELDSVQGVSWLPEEKLVKLRELLAFVRSRVKVTLRELQVLLGHLNFACRVIAPGRPFCARLGYATAGVRSPHHHIRVTQGMREDLQVWVQFLEGFNGVSMWSMPFSPEAGLQIYSDAAGSAGFGVYFQGRWCAQLWPDSWSRLRRDLTFLEFFPILVAVVLWGEELRDKRVTFWCDNAAVVQIINRQSSKSRRVMTLVRKFVLTCLEFNIVFLSTHVPGLDNEIADALSRQQWDRFRSLAPEARSNQEVFPLELWDLGEE